MKEEQGNHLLLLMFLPRHYSTCTMYVHVHVYVEYKN